MFDTLAVVIAAMSKAIYVSSDTAISGMCSLAFTQILPAIAGLVVGLAILKSFFDDDLAALFRALIAAGLPLFFVVWLIKPAEGGCHIVGIKNDVLALRAQATSVIAPEFAGGPADMIGKSTKKMAKLLEDFQNKINQSGIQHLDENFKPADLPKSPKTTAPQPPTLMP